MMRVVPFENSEIQKKERDQAKKEKATKNKARAGGTHPSRAGVVVRRAPWTTLSQKFWRTFERDSAEEKKQFCHDAQQPSLLFQRFNSRSEGGDTTVGSERTVARGQPRAKPSLSLWSSSERKARGCSARAPWGQRTSPAEESPARIRRRGHFTEKRPSYTPRTKRAPRDRMEAQQRPQHLQLATAVRC
jgi:hypothetical protein